MKALLLNAIGVAIASAGMPNFGAANQPGAQAVVVSQINQPANQPVNQPLQQPQQYPPAAAPPIGSGQSLLASFFQSQGTPPSAFSYQPIQVPHAQQPLQIPPQQPPLATTNALKETSETEWSKCPGTCNGVEDEAAFKETRRTWWRCAADDLLTCYVNVLQRVLVASQSKLCRCNTCHFPDVPGVNERLRQYLSTMQYNQQNQQLLKQVANCVRPIFNARMEALGNRILQSAYACQLDVRAVEDLEHMVMHDMAAYLQCLDKNPTLAQPQIPQ